MLKSMLDGRVSRAALLACLVFVLLGTLTLASYRYAVQLEHARIANAFDELAKFKAQRVQGRVDSYARTLLDLRGLFAADPNVTEDEFQRFLRGVEVTRRFPPLVRIGYAARVTESNRVRLQNQLRRMGLAGYQGAVGDFPTLYAFPPNIQLLGIKLNEGTLRSEVLDLARDSTEPRLSPQLALRLDDEHKPGHVIYLPLYGTDPAPATLEQRRQSLSGYLFAVFRIQDLIDTTIGPDLERRMGMALYDGPVTDPAKLLYDSGQVARMSAREAARMYANIQRVAVSGRTWTFLFVTRPSFVRDNQSMLPAAVLIGGLLTSFLAAWLANAAARRLLVESRIRHLAFHDDLTGLPNRARLRLAIDEAIEHERATKRPCALLIVELVRFRDINYTVGHLVGDEVLTQASERIRAVASRDALVARVSNVQFGVLMPGAGTSEAIDCARRLVAALEEPLPARGSKYELGARVGIVSVPAHGTDTDELIRHADIARNIARSSATDCVVYDPRLDPYQPQRLALLGAFRQAVKQEQLQLYCQPKADLRTGLITSVEGLVRWQHPEYGLIMPNQFISLIEPTELIQLLTERILEIAIRQCYQWRQQDIFVPMAVNLSTRNLLNPNLPEIIHNLMHSWGADASWLALEITESSIIEDSPVPLRVVNRLHAMGLKLCVDDFGTGYSSLSYLMKLPISVVKIDHSFTTNMLNDRDAAAIVKAIIELAHNMDMTVVAEGAATREIWDALKRLDCDEAQGYYISPPFPAATFQSWLERSPWELARPAVLVPGNGQ
jgi:diguanylate cyclase (GGDEF)-like protein